MSGPFTSPGEWRRGEERTEESNMKEEITKRVKTEWQGQRSFVRLEPSTTVPLSSAVMRLSQGDSTQQAMADGRGAANWEWKSFIRVWLCDPMDYTVRGILQVRTLECIDFPFSRGSSQSRNRTQVSCIAGGFFTSWSTREALIMSSPQMGDLLSH